MRTKAMLLLASLLLGACSEEPPTGPLAHSRAPGRPSFTVAVISLTDLGRPLGSAFAAVGRAINAHGQIAGVEGTSAFRWTNGAVQALFLPDRPAHQVGGINASGAIAGSASGGADGPRGFTWLPDRVRLHAPLPTYTGSFVEDINAAGVVVGRSTTMSATRATRWVGDGDPQDLGTLPGGDGSSAFGVNDAGQIVGASTNASSLSVPVLWADGTVRELGILLGGDRGVALDINELGQIVGSSTDDGSGEPDAVVWVNGQAQRIPPLAGTNSSQAEAINNLGQIVGWMSGLDGPHGFVHMDGATYDLGRLPNANRALAFDINDNGQVVGTSSERLALWTVPLWARIDALPGNATNTVRLAGSGSIQVAVLSNPYFNATRVDPASLTLGNEDGSDTPVAQRPNRTLNAQLKDVDRDGDVDLLVAFDKQALVRQGDLSTATTRLVLLGKTKTGLAIRGSDAINATP